MIKEISMAGIKGQDAVQKLTGRDIIAGRNGSGKTTRLQAMSLAAFGYVPERGKTAEATFELASENTMTVGISTETINIQREYIKSGKLAADGTTDFKITQEIRISPSKGERTIKQKEARISEAVGDFPTMLDFGAFLELTDNKKRDFIYNLSGSDFSWDREKVKAALEEAVLRGDLEENNPEMYDIMQKNCADTMAQYAEGVDVQSGLLAMSEYAKDKLSYWKKEKTNSDAAARKLTELKNRAMDTDRDLAENQEKLKAMEAEKEAHVETLAKIKAHNQQWDAKEAELQKIRSEIADMESAETNGEEVEALREKAEILQGSITNVKSEVEKMRERVDQMREYDNAMVSRMKEKRDYIAKIDAEIAGVKATIKTNTDLIETINANAGFCAFSRDIPCHQDFGGFLAERQDLISGLYEKLDELNDTANKQKTEYSDMGREQAENKEKARVIMNEISAIKEEGEGFRNQLSECQEKLNAAENRSPILAAKAHQAEEIEAWLAEAPKAEEDVKIETIDALKAKIEALIKTIDEQKRVRNDILNIKANIIDSQTAAYEAECWGQIAVAIGQKGIKGSIVKEMLDPIKADIDAKLQTMDIDASFYFETESDRGKEIFSFGYSTNRGKRPFNALSQGEQMLLLIALMTTIIEKRDTPIKILAIDNSNHLDPINYRKIIKGLSIAGANMDNIILAGTIDIPDEEAPGWKIWRLEE